HARHLAIRRHVDQHAAREEYADLLDAQLLQAPRRAELRQLVAVVEVIVAAHADADVPQAVELRTDLADLAGEHLLVVDAAVLAVRPAGRPTGDGEAEVTLAWQRHAMLINPAQRVDLARTDELGRGQRPLGGQAVGGAALVVGAPLRRPPLRADGRLDV